MKARWLLTAFLAAVGLLTLAAPAWAQDDEPTDDEVNAIAKGMYCPVCENVPLDVCPTQACKQWRETIREKLALGWTQAQIESYFVEQYGDRVLASPPPRGLNWAVYVLPPIAFLGGGFLLFQVFRSWRGPAPESASLEAASPSPGDDPYLDRLEEELRQRA